MFCNLTIWQRTCQPSIKNAIFGKPFAKPLLTMKSAGKRNPETGRLAEPALMAVIDEGVLAEILDGLSPADRSHFVETFISDVKTQLERTLIAHSGFDLDELARAVHALKGVALTIGADNLAAHAAELNRRLADEETGLTGAAMDELASRAIAVLAALADMHEPMAAANHI